MKVTKKRLVILSVIFLVIYLVITLFIVLGPEGTGCTPGQEVDEGCQVAFPETYFFMLFPATAFFLPVLILMIVYYAIRDSRGKKSK